jgi:hypothetical protein
MSYCIKNLRAEHEQIPQIIEKIAETKDKKQIKILVQPWNGLADSLGSLNTVLYYALHISKLDPKQIFFKNIHHYQDLNKFLDFTGINYYENNTDVVLEEQFDIIINKGYFVGLYWTHPNHFRNYISFNFKLIKEASQYKSRYAIHLRNKLFERYCKQKKASRFIKKNKPVNSTYNLKLDKKTTIDRIKSLANTDRSTYFISADSTLYTSNNFEPTSNIKIIEKHVDVAMNKHRLDAKPALLDLAIMSLCETIYVTVHSGFSILAVLLSNNKDLAFCINVNTNTNDLLSIIKDKGYIKNLFEPRETETK